MIEIDFVLKSRKYYMIITEILTVQIVHSAPRNILAIQTLN